MNKRPGIREVAQHAGVSFKTVSRVVNNSENVTPETREKVQSSIRELGYIPNAMAKSLKSGGTSTIGVIVDAIDDVFFATLADEVEQLALADGIEVVLASTGYDSGRELDQLQRMAGLRVQGIIMAPVDAGNLASLGSQLPPSVMIDRQVAGRDSVFVDDFAAAAEAVDALIDMGHTRILFLGADESMPTARRRLDGYKDALTRAGIAVDRDLIPEDSPRRQSVDAALAGAHLTGALRLPDPPTAVFAGNARMGAVVVTACHEIGRVDLALMSFGDFALSAVVTPRVHCIDQDPRQFASLAYHRLREVIGGVDGPSVELIAPTKLVLRTEGALVRNTP